MAPWGEFIWGEWWGWVGDIIASPHLQESEVDGVGVG